MSMNLKWKLLAPVRAIIVWWNQMIGRFQMKCFRYGLRHMPLSDSQKELIVQTLSRELDIAVQETHDALAAWKEENNITD